ncbi:MAG: hypothetical protein AAGG00_03635, partial [Cyanobacteria bacterium P01_H01_bin.150]
AKLIVSLRATAKQSQSVAMSHTLRVNASFHSVPLAMTNAQLILPKYLLLATKMVALQHEGNLCPKVPPGRHKGTDTLR